MFWIALPVFVVIAGCARKQTAAPIAAAPAVPSATEIARLHADKTRVVVALRLAQTNLPKFVRALRKPKPSQTQFAVKAGIFDGRRTQHVWLNDVTFDGKKFRGKLGNRVLGVKNAKLGDKVEVAPSGVSDWMYVENRKLIGGYTLRALRDGLSPQDKKSFDKSLPFVVS